MIKTENGNIVIHAERVFYHGSKAMNIDIAKKNLLDFRRILNHNSIKFGLIYGTLLGAIREQNFIEHDEDTDVYILDEEKEDFLESLADFEKENFLVGRYDENGLLSLVREGEYIDVYFFKKTQFGNRIRNGHQIVKENFLIDTIEYDFLGESFNIARHYEDFLVYLYGKDWKTPKVNVFADTPTLTVKLARYIHNNFPKLFQYAVSLRNFLYKKIMHREWV